MMEWTLYMQLSKGKWLKEPGGLHNVTVNSDLQDQRLYAFRGGLCCGELLHPVIALHLEGILVEGVERHIQRDVEVFYWQKWWLVPEVRITIEAIEGEIK